MHLLVFHAPNDDQKAENRDSVLDSAKMKTTHSLLHGTATKVTEARHTAPLLCEAVSEPLPKLSRDDTAQAKARVRHSAPLPFQDYRRVRHS